MKLPMSRLLGAFLIVGALLSHNQAQATPYRWIEARGVIQAVDYTNSSFTILDKKDRAETFNWNSGTWFRQKTPKPCASWFSRLFLFGKTANTESLQPGRSVWVYYRKVDGHFIVREIAVLLPVSTSHCRPAAGKNGGILSPAA